MGKALIIAEKPSVAADIAKALGGLAKDKSGEFFEDDRYVVSSAVGHLLELTVPEEFEIKKGKWSFASLPHIPPRFALKPIEKSENRLKVLARLIKRKDVSTLVNACDAGREGELIFRNIVSYTGARQPVQRLWLQSMTPAAIRDGFQQLRTDEQMRPLADASVCRSEADWLVGINGTRAMTAFNSKTGGFHLTTVGRVQTPTLAIVVEREEKIRRFVSRDFWEVIATFEGGRGAYPGRWFDEKFAKGDDKDPDLKAERIWDRARAESIREKCLGRPGVVTEESKPSTSMSPLLYDLTTLQREANGRFGFSAKNTLGLAQALYERHKVLTYPRTDSRALPEDYLATVRQTLGAFSETPYSAFAGKILAEGWVRPNKRIFNNAKVSDHFAIIPTGVVPKGLSEPEQKLYDLVTKRFLAVFYPPAEFLETVRITRVEGEPFKSTGKVLVKPGWLEVYGKEADSDESPTLAPVDQGERVATTVIDVKASVTKPPARYTEATLLSAMEGAGKLVDDEELREAMSERGLGTPATRAAIIEGLISEQYLLRQQRELMPTAKAFSLITLLNGLGVETLTKPEMTGNWEYQLKQMERNQLRREDFMAEIRRLTENIVGKAKQYEHDTIPGDFGVLKTPCPKCGGDVHETYKKFQCQKCDFALWKITAGRQFEPAEIEALIRDRQIGPLQGFRSKQGFPFAAIIKLTPEFEAKFDFGDDDKKENAEPVDFTGKEPVGKCPKCGARVFEHGMNYVCEKAVSAERTCDFKTGAIILQQAVDRVQIAKLLSEGKTDLLKGFVSKKTGRKFEAFLKYEGGKVGFEFAPRARKGPARPGKGPSAVEAPAAKIDFTGLKSLGKCPKCQGQVFEGPDSYVCERSQAETRKCTFRIGKVILQQPVSPETATRLLVDGRSEILPGFVSKAGKTFPAHLVLGEKGKVEFEFPPR
ncbi:MAG: DNA topoisomerase III [Verrucomicrobiota bacterium]